MQKYHMIFKELALGFGVVEPEVMAPTNFTKIGQSMLVIVGGYK